MTGPQPTSYRLLAADRTYYRSAEKGTLGGNRRGALYGRLDCPAALHALARPSAATFRRFRVFFADEATAQAAGFRPCARCLPAAYRAWKAGPRPGEAYPWARRLAAVPEAHDIRTRMLTEERPGYIVYEDEVQVLAEPFRGERPGR